MTDWLSLLTDLSQVLGVPAAIAVAYAIFIIRDHSKRITLLEDNRSEAEKELDRKLNDIYNRINEIAVAVAKIQGKMGIEE